MKDDDEARRVVAELEDSLPGAYAIMYDDFDRGNLLSAAIGAVIIGVAVTLLNFMEFVMAKCDHYEKLDREG